MSIGDLRIETGRLILRPLKIEDFDAFAAFHADIETMRFLGGVQPREIAWRTLMMMAGAWHLQGCSMFSLFEKATGRWVGRAGPWKPEGWPGTEVGWGVVRDCWGRGYATEAATASIDWAFDQLGWTEVIHTITPGNDASERVAAKLGSRKRGRGHLPPPLSDVPVEIWGQTRDAWRQR